MALDNFRKVNITLNKANQRVLETQIAKVGDANGRELVVQITNNGIIEDQTGTTLKLNWQHENGKQGSTNFKVVDIKTGRFSVYYPTEMLYKGEVNANIEITSNGQITNSMNFKIIVQADVFNGEAGTVNGVFISLADVNKKLDDREKEYVELKNRQSNVENQFNDIKQEITNKDIISAPEIIAARGGLPQLEDRLDATDAQLAQTAGLGNYTETPIYKNGVLSKILKTDGTESTFTYNTDGTLNTVTETILDRTVLTTMNYKDGQFTSVTRVVGGEAITYPSTLIASVDNYLVDYHDDALFLSRDGGKTYAESLYVPQLGNIKYIHLFKDGELLICDHKKAYYSHDWKTIYDSTVLDLNGNIYTPSEFDNFTSNKKNTNRQIIDGQEILCWGNYSIANPMPPINVWYTTDKGKTIKSCYQFNVSGSLSCRHIHNVNFNPQDKSFWLQTGDEPSGSATMSHVLKGYYDIYSDNWVWNIVGSGLDFKWSTIEFFEDNVYFAHDISKGGIKTCLYTDIADSSKHVKIMETNNDTVGMYIGKRGDMIVIQSVYGGSMSPRNFYYSEDRITFHTIEGSVPSEVDYTDAMYYGYWAPNANGKILTGVWSMTKETLDVWNRTPSVFLDDFIRSNGFPNAFK